MADPGVLVVHERRATWARQLRPRAAAWGVRFVETRSGDGLIETLKGSSHGLLVLDLGDRPASGLDDLSQAMAQATTTMALVLDPGSRDGIGPLARELGATLVLPGQVIPPVVVGILARWRTIAARRAASEGWPGQYSEQDDPFADLLATTSTSTTQRTT